ncbi:MAG: ABC-F family ATP-binding cassette domain-containing protein [Rhodospirillales bacterium]
MAPPLLILRGVYLTFGGTPLLEGAEMSVSRGERLCLVGRNGSGKSTLLKIAAGQIDPDRGERFVQPGTTIRYLPQEPDLSDYESTLAYVEGGLAPGDDPYRAQYLLEQLGLKGDEPPRHLSGGQARRAALARVLAPKPDIVLLDEPTNHLDLPAIEWLERELRSMSSALVIISHDRRFLENLSRATIWIDRGQARRLEKGFGAFEDWRDEVIEQESLERHKLSRKIAAETHWLIHGVSGRRKRNMRRLGALRDIRNERANLRQATGDVKLNATIGDPSGKLVIEAKSIAKAYGETVIAEDFSTRILRGDRVGLIGPNGVGKTTLVNMLTGVMEPDRGTVRIGAAVDMVTLDQGRESLDPGTTLADALTGGGGDKVEVAGMTKHVIGYMKDFLFLPEQAGTPIGELSGGERGRLMLARALTKPSNLLVLDEPTNDLDLETLDLLQEMIADYPGAVLLVSHDRDFIDRVVTSVIAWEAPGQWREYPGGYNDMVAQRKGALDAREPEPDAPARKPRTGGASPDAARQAQQRKSKLTYSKMHALKTLPDKIAKCEAAIADCQEVLADPDLFMRDPARFQKAVDAMQRAQEEQAALEQEWLDLEIEREALERLDSA